MNKNEIIVYALLTYPKSKFIVTNHSGTIIKIVPDLKTANSMPTYYEYWKFLIIEDDLVRCYIKKSLINDMYMVAGHNNQYDYIDSYQFNYIDSYVAWNRLYEFYDMTNGEIIAYILLKYPKSELNSKHISNLKYVNHPDYYRYYSTIGIRTQVWFRIRDNDGLYYQIIYHLDKKHFSVIGYTDPSNVLAYNAHVCDTWQEALTKLYELDQNIT